MQELTSILSSCSRCRGAVGGRVWRLDGISRAVDECKTRLLDAICARFQPFVAYDEPPDPTSPLHAATEVAANVWRLPLGASGSAVLSWLYRGNWQLYVARSPLVAIPDLCRARDAEVERFVAASEVAVIIDSFHDDVSWVIGLGDDAAYDQR